MPVWPIEPGARASRKKRSEATFERAMFGCISFTATRRCVNACSAS
jgi:hypothetical protein